MYDMIIALILTIVIEMLCLLILQKNDKIIIASVVLNVVTNVTLNFILYFFLDAKLIIYVFLLVILEILVLFVETYVYYKLIRNIRQALFLSLLLNVTSFLLGLLILNIN